MTSAPTVATAPAPASLDVASARALLADDPTARVLDVRTPGEFESAHVAGSVNIPVDQVDANLDRLASETRGHMVLVCQAGPRAQRAHELLTAAGRPEVSVLEGGMNAWVSAGAPVERSDRQRWGLERQVRLVAGSIVLSAVVASVWLEPLKYVAGFVGAGLTFAALSNTCAMGNLLSRLPYNRSSSADVDAAVARLAR
jgi:rhodanese-related sulfurtransferase